MNFFNHAVWLIYKTYWLLQELFQK